MSEKRKFWYYVVTYRDRYGTESEGLAFAEPSLEGNIDKGHQFARKRRITKAEWLRAGGDQCPT